MANNRKIKYNIDEQIGHMETRGITFNICSKENAKLFLTESNYYFKIKAFAKLFNTDKDPKRYDDYKYINLDFAYIKELSVLDTIFRKIVLELSLAVEHLLKVILNEHLCNNSLEDGYKIVDNFLQEGRKTTLLPGETRKGVVPKAFNMFSKNRTKVSFYIRELMDKYYPDNFATWNFVEILTFSEFIAFLEFYNSKYPIQKLNKTCFSLLFVTRILRNTSAHNNCVLNALVREHTEDFSVTSRLLTQAKKNIKSFSNKQISIFCKNPVIHDYLGVLLIFNKLCPEEMKKKLSEKTMDRINRFQKHINYFQTNEILYKQLDFIIKATEEILN